MRPWLLTTQGVPTAPPPWALATRTPCKDAAGSPRAQIIRRRLIVIIEFPPRLQ
jgi:hypothetical protein